MKAGSAPGETFQDSGNDPRFAVTALAERQVFASASIFGGYPAVLTRRLEMVDR